LVGQRQPVAQRDIADIIPRDVGLDHKAGGGGVEAGGAIARLGRAHAGPRSAE
jgi:hypothetical protein